MSVLQKSFEDRFEQFKSTLNPSSTNLKGYYVADN